MKNKLNKNAIENHNSEKITRYAIRKASFGATSVAVAACFMYLGQGSVAAADNNIQNQENKISSTDENINSDIKNTIERTSNETVVKSTVVALDKTKLSSLIAEIESKIVSGAYDTKTEDSVAKLRVELGTVKTVLENAKTQEELTRAYNKLITATTQLKTKPEEKKEALVVDTTNGKATVGNKATNTEKTKESNSITNSGSRDERNGKALNTNNPFRADAATTNDDPSANQTYTAPAENATLAELIQKLKNLAEHIENNDKIKDIDSIGATKNVEAGTVKEIDEFGGWTAVDGGKFAITRKTAEGVYPLETINSTLDDTVWLQEQALDRRTEYTLLLSKSITRANRYEAAWDGSVYKPTGVAGGVTKNVARYKGIEKTFTAYSTLYGSDVVVKFKPGYLGDSDGSKANYKVQVYSITGNQETLVYETTFDPSKNANDDKKIVTKATDGKNKAKIKISNTPNSTTIDGGVDHTKRVDFIGKTEAEKLMAKPENLPNGESGTFTSKLIALPKGADHYKVRISLADQNRTGMSYQAWDEKYSVPVTGLDFSIAQDTSNVARNLLQRIYDKLKATESADKNGKTAQTIQDYEAELEKVKLLLADPAARTANFKQALEDLLAKQLGLKTDKTGLTNSKEELDALVNEDPTPGKTQDTATAYNAAKQEAVKAIEAAKTVIDNENATVAQVREALNKVNVKKTALQQAKDGLIVAATAEEKAKLKIDADSLVKADTTGKTPNSIAAYNTKYEALKTQLEAAKAEAATVLAKENNASKAEAQAAQAKVDAVKAELTKAAELLVNKADKTELTKAKEVLSTLVSEADPTTGKTVDSAKTYNDAKTAATEEIKAAKKVINDENATQEQVTEALNKVNEKKAALEAAKQALVEAATTEEKAKLKTDADSLVKADTTGKTPNSVAAYNTKYEELKAQLEAAKTEAATVLAKENNATNAEVEAAQVKVDAVKAELENAKNLLVEAATTEEKTKLKEGVDSLVKADTTGKTPNSIKAYEAEFEKLKTQLEEAKAAAAVATKGDNATKTEVQEAQAKVDAAKTALEKAAELLKDKADKTELTKAKEALSTLVSEVNSTTGKTADSAKAYNDAKTAALEAIKVSETVINDENATQEQVTEALNKVNEKKAALEAAKQALVEAATAEEKAKLKADAALLTKADETGKTPDSIAAYERKYEELKTQLEAAKSEATTVLAKENNASKAEAQAAQAKVDVVKKALEKAAELLKDLVDKTKLTTEATTEAEATKGSPAYYNAEEAKKAAYDKALAEAKKVLENDKATQAEVNAALKALEEAKAALNGQPTNKDALTKAATTEAEATKGSPAYYNAEEAKKAAYDKALAEAKKVLENDKATQAEVNAALKALEEAKAALNGQPTNKDALTKAATTEAEATKGSPAYYNAEEAKKAAYDKALAEAKKVLENDKATQAEVNAALKALEEAKAALNGQPTNKDALTKAATTDAEETKGSPAYYNADEAKKAAYDKALAEAKKVLENDKATQAEVNAALKALEEAKAALNGQPTNKDALTKAATTDAEETKGSPAYYNADEAKKSAYDKALAEAKKVLENDKATQAEVNAALKALEEAKAGLNGYVSHKINPAISEVEEFDITELIVKGIVEVEKGRTLNENDIKSKLNLPDGIEIVEIEYPETNTLGRKVVRVVLRGNDGNLFTVEVPVEVVEGKGFNNISIGNDNSANNGSKDKVDSETNQKLLPNTGTTETNTGLAGLGLAVLGGLLAVAKRRKEK